MDLPKLWAQIRSDLALFGVGVSPLTRSRATRPNSTRRILCSRLFAACDSRFSPPEWSVGNTRTAAPTSVSAKNALIVTTFTRLGYAMYQGRSNKACLQVGQCWSSARLVAKSDKSSSRTLYGRFVRDLLRVLSLAKRKEEKQDR